MNNRNIIHNLTGLRAFAAIWVVVFNAASYEGMDPGFVRAIDWGIFTNFIRHGWMGVDLFFILSGFVISYVYQSHFENGLNKTNIFKYYKLRLGRIYPLHFVLLIICFAIFIANIPPFSDHLNFGRLLHNLTLTTSWGVSNYADWNGPAWSLSAEWFAYLLFPFLCHYIIPKKSVRTIMLSFFAIIIIAFLFALDTVELDTENPLGWLLSIISYPFIMIGNSTQMDDGTGALLRVSLEFSLGCMMYNLYRLNIGSTWKWHYLCLLAWVIFILSLYVELPFAANLVVSVISAPMIILTMAKSQRIIQLIFANKLMVYLGNVSFAIYMAHQPVFALLRHNFGTYYQSIVLQNNQPLLLFNLLGVLTILIAVACILYHIIEQPCRKFVKRRVKL